MSNSFNITHVSLNIDSDLSKVLSEFCKKNGFKKKEFIEIAIKNELNRRFAGEVK